MIHSPHLRPVPNINSDEETLKPQARISEGNRLVEFLSPMVETLKGSDNQHYVAFIELPHLVFPHQGGSSESMQQISHRSFMDTSRWPSATAKGLAADFLSARCSMGERVDVSLRAQFVGGSIYLDTAWPSNQVIKVGASGVELLDTAPARFVRNGVTGPLPTYTDDEADLCRLLHYVRIDRAALPALLASLINTFMTHLPQPLLLLQGPAAAGKTTSLRFLLDLVDPSTKLPGGSLTANERDMRALSKVRRVMVFDNVSYVKGDVSDLLAKITTGSEMTYRALFENSTPDVMELQRPVFLNGIIEGFSRSDLASRAVSFELEAITGERRMSSDELSEGWKNELPRIFWSLLKLASQVLRELPNEPRPESSFRNPELVKMTKIIGRILGIEGQTFLETSVTTLSQSVLGASHLGHAFTEFVHCVESDSDFCNADHKAAHLGKPLRLGQLQAILNAHVDEDKANPIPTVPKAFGEALQRIKGDLESVLGLTIDKRRTRHGVEYTLSVREK